jgi:hypothetical protein
VGLCNSLTSVYAGVVVFLILGFLANKTGKNVEDVVNGGISLAFVSYPSAVMEMDIPPFWSFLFFFMLINLAMSSICGGVQTFLAFILDEKPSLSAGGLLNRYSVNTAYSQYTVDMHLLKQYSVDTHLLKQYSVDMHLLKQYSVDTRLY